MYKDWEQRKLEQISDKVTEKNKQEIFKEVLTNSAEFGIVSQESYFDKEIANVKNISGYYIVRPNDFVYNPRISNFAPVGPIKRNTLFITGIMSPLYYVFRTKNISTTYLQKYFESTHWHRFMYMNGDSGARSDRFAIKDTTFNEMPIPYPVFEEQKSIANFISKLDKIITLHQRKINRIHRLKSSYTEKIFPEHPSLNPVLRFGKYNKPWRKYSLKDVTSHRGGTAIEKHFSNQGEYKVISIGSYSLNSNYIDQGIRVDSNEVTDSRLVFKNELTMVLNDKTATGDIIGRTLLINENNKYVINQRTEIITPSVNFNSQFAYFILNGPFRKQVKRIVQGGTQIYLNYSSVEKLPLSLPKLGEQEKIGEFFKNLDIELNQYQLKIDTLVKIKQIYLSKMFI